MGGEFGGAGGCGFGGGAGLGGGGAGGFGLGRELGQAGAESGSLGGGETGAGKVATQDREFGGLGGLLGGEGRELGGEGGELSGLLGRFGGGNGDLVGCGQLLADLGADVVKVERRGAGDDTRQWGPPFLEGHDGENLGAAYYHASNRGKRCIEADFETPEGRALIERLAMNADVVIENFKVGGLAKYGLDHESLRRLNPRLIYCSITGFGQDGPYAERAGYDFLVQG